MMNRTHSLSGGVGWLAGCATAAWLGHPPGTTVVVVGAVVAAGCAILPDADHPSSTVARTFGPASQFVSRGIAWLCAQAHDATRARCRDDCERVRCSRCPDRINRRGHRTVTHTLLFALALGGVFAALGWFFGRVVGVGLIAATAGLACRALFTERERGAWGASLTALTAGAAAFGFLPPDHPWWWLGIPVAMGCFIHSLGDAITESAVPLAWPLPIKGRRWHRIGPPRPMRMRTGGWAEQIVFVVVLLGGAGSLWFLVTGPVR